MTVLIAIGAIIGGIVLAWFRMKFRGVRKLLDGVAIAAYLGFFATSASTVMRTLLDGTVFMTQVHSVLNNGVFLVCGAYLGPYGLGLLFNLLWGERKQPG